MKLGFEKIRVWLTAPTRVCKIEIRNSISTYFKPYTHFLLSIVKGIIHFNTLSINHIMYFLLWLIAALSLVAPDCFGELFDSLIKVDDFGIIGQPFIKNILYIFAVVTLLIHQAFIYQSLHIMEHEKSEFEKKYQDWFGTRIEWLLRASILILLLAGVGKIYGLEELIYEVYEGVNDFEPNQNLIISTSTLLFFTLTIWNLIAACKCGAWEYLESDLIALLFWGSIFVIANGFWSGTPHSQILPVLLVGITLYYLRVMYKRVYGYLKSNLKKSQQYANQTHHH